MDLYEAKSDRGLERRVDEDDLRNLYRAGFLHPNSLVRRSGSPNWFQVQEMFPTFERIASAKKYSANLQSPARKLSAYTVFFILLAVLIVGVLLLRVTRRLEVPMPARKTQSED